LSARWATPLANGSFTYAPDAGFSGVDTFQYRASDGIAVSSPATVTISVIPATAATPRPTPIGSPSATPASSPAESPTGTGPPQLDRSPRPSSQPGQGGTSSSPAPTPALALAGAPDEPIAPFSLDFAFGGMQFDWFIPVAVVGGPGLLVIVAIALQLFGALAWLPAVRRYLGSAGSRRSGRST